jgi:cytochrome c oxidase subunit IIa family protein
MTDPTLPVHPGRSSAALEHIEEHPRGTLAIVCIFGLLFVLGWLGTYVLVFLERGAPHS